MKKRSPENKKTLKNEKRDKNKKTFVEKTLHW